MQKQTDYICNLLLGPKDIQGFGLLFCPDEPKVTYLKSHKEESRSVI